MFLRWTNSLETLKEKHIYVKPRMHNEMTREMCELKIEKPLKFTKISICLRWFLLMKPIIAFRKGDQNNQVVVISHGALRFEANLSSKEILASSFCFFAFLLFSLFIDK